MMWYDDYDLPIESNANDKQDSARLAGFLVTFEWPRDINLTLYFQNSRYVRHLSEYNYDFSRDSYICLISGFRKQGEEIYVSESYVNGKDFMSPTIKGHEQRCKGLKSTLWQDAWLVGDIIAYALECLYEIDEPNQLLCMVEIAGPKWLKFFCAITPWKKALRKYWIYTRAKPEVELAEWVIKYVSEKIKT